MRHGGTSWVCRLCQICVMHAGLPSLIACTAGLRVPANSSWASSASTSSSSGAMMVTSFMRVFSMVCKKHGGLGTLSAGPLGQGFPILQLVQLEVIPGAYIADIRKYQRESLS